ncbi:MAG: hypothetical protein QOI89_51 [Solirubrobacteraceae bacterium]|jgi:hypothetical protein|nr:hypothetical protein [Solirubrobacteraceae bacterium]
MVRAVLARQRRLGTSFEDAWALALTVLDRPTSTTAEAIDVEVSLTALRRTEEDWRLAYERLPPRPAPYPMTPLDAFVGVAA